MTWPRFYLTTAIPYANGAPHIGHAYERIACDAIQRFMRLDGRDVFFVTGMDEHGLKMAQAASRAGLTPQAFADLIAKKFEAMGDALNARADDIVRTTEPRHKRTTQALWELMRDNGDIYLDKYSGWYSVRDEAYFDADELKDSPDGGKLAPSGAPAEWVEEESYFFRLSDYAEPLLRHYEAHPDFVTPDHYKNEIVAFVRRGLKDLSISRTTFNWGIPVPGDPRHVMYVWVDALTNYFTATDYLDGGERAKYWPADAHVIGKDITRFHAVYWPAFLMSAKLPLPKQIVVHGFLFNRGEKMSKSVGNVVDPMELARLYGVDALRYFFLREVPFGQDGSYSQEAIVQRMNADLANDLGNLAQRSLSIIARNCGGAIPDWRDGVLSPEGRALLARADDLVHVAREHMKTFALHLYLGAVFEVVAEANRYFAAAEPWRLARSNPAQMRIVLYVTAEVLRIVAILLQPAMPASMEKLLDQLGVDLRSRSFADVDQTFGDGTRIAADLNSRKRLKPRAAPPPEAVFPRYVEPV